MLRRALVVGLLVALPLAMVASSCAPLTAAQIAADGNNPLKEAENSFLQWVANVILPIIVPIAAPSDPG